jgi:hypothetical protein
VTRPARIRWHTEPGDEADARLGLRANLSQFMLLAVVNFFVGSMVGLERTVTPLVGSEQFHLGELAIAAFVVVWNMAGAARPVAALCSTDKVAAAARSPVTSPGAPSVAATMNAAMVSTAAPTPTAA